MMTNHHAALQTRMGAVLLLIALCGGCQAVELVGGALQNNEYQKLVDTPPKYAGLQDHTVAVVVTADMSTMYEFPTLVSDVAGGVSQRLQRDVPGIKVLGVQHVIKWQYRTPQWSALPYGEIAEQLNVERVVYVDMLEYRLNPPGNRWMWEGVARATVGVIERGGFDQDSFAETFEVAARYPSVEGLGAESAPRQNIDFGLKYSFIEKTSWLFYQHLEPKYPDKYRPEMESKKKS